MTRLNLTMLASSLVLVASLVQQSSARSLLQTGSTCRAVIPQSEANRCYLQTVSGKMQNVCERCTAGYIATENGLNCGECTRGAAIVQLQARQQGAGAPSAHLTTLSTCYKEDLERGALCRRCIIWNNRSTLLLLLLLLLSCSLQTWLLA